MEWPARPLKRRYAIRGFLATTVSFKTTGGSAPRTGKDDRVTLEHAAHHSKDKPGSIYRRSDDAAMDLAIGHGTKVVDDTSTGTVRPEESVPYATVHWRVWEIYLSKTCASSWLSRTSPQFPSYVLIEHLPTHPFSHSTLPKLLRSMQANTIISTSYFSFPSRGWMYSRIGWIG